MSNTNHTCPDCEDGGYVDGEMCETCHGAAWLRRHGIGKRSIAELIALTAPAPIAVEVTRAAE